MIHSRQSALFLLPLFIALGFAADEKKPGDLPKTDRVDPQGDPLPPGVLARMGTIRFRHGAQVQLLQYSQDGKVLASLGVDQIIRLWETSTGKELQSVHAAEAANAPFALSADGKLLATTNFTRVRILDARTGKELHVIDDPNGNVTCVAFSPDSKLLAATSGADDVQLIDVATGKEQKRVKAPQNQGNQGFYHQQLSFSPDGGTLAAVGFRDNKTVVDFISVSGGTKARDIDLQQQNVPFLVFGPDHKTIALWGFDQDIHIVDLKTGKELHKLNMPQGVVSLAYSHDGKFLVACSGQNTFSIWDVTEGKEANPDDMLKTPITVAAFAPDGKTLAVGGTSSIIRMLDRKKGKDIHQFGGHVGGVDQVVLSPDGKTLATIAQDHTVRLWEVATAKEIRTIEGPGADQPGAALGGGVEFSPDGKHLAVAWASMALVLYETATGKEVRSFGDKENPLGFSCVGFTPDGKSLAAVCGDGLVRFWDVRSGKEVRHLPNTPAKANPNPNPNVPEQGEGAGLSVLAFSPNGKLMLTIGTDASDGTGASAVLTVWELATGKERQRIRFKDAIDGLSRVQAGLGGFLAPPPVDGGVGGGASGLAMVISPDGRFVALTTGSAIRLVDLVRGKEVRQFGAQGECLCSGMFSPDGKLLAAGASDGSVRVWEVSSGTALGEFPGHRGPVTALAYATDGKSIATGGNDTTAMIWDVPYLMESLKVTRTAPAQAELDRLTKDLESEDAEKAGKAIWALVDSPKESLPFLKERIRPAEKVDDNKVAELIKDLNSEEFEARKLASEELSKLGELVEPALRKRLEEKPELEVQTRIEELLAKLEKPVTSPEIMSALRMIEVLEHIGTPEARAILDGVGKGAEGSRITREARAATQRLAKRTSP
jgi:WD40 repeat protein